MRELIWKSIFIVAIALGLFNASCASLDSLMNPSGPTKVKTEDSGDDGKLVKFSENPNTLNPTDRSYHRMTRNRMEEESQLQAQAGSMWVMEGQGAYLFAQNKMRKEGDLLNVKIEGSAQKQIETKVGVIKKLLAQLEDELKKQQSLDQSSGVGGLLSDNKPKDAGEAQRNPAAVAGAAQANAGNVADKAEKKDELPVGVETVPTRISEKMPDGSYRVKGTQPFMIDNKEYKVIVTGLVRPEDFSDEGVSSNKILDPQYDVVSIRRGKNE